MNAATAELLADVEAFLRRYIVFGDDERATVTLWVLHSYVVEALGVTPYLAVSSAEKESGKTQLLEALSVLVAKPWLTGSMSAATLVRKIEQRPTLLLDETDAAFNGDRDYAEALRGVLNTGYRASGTYSRCVGASGTNLKVEDFSTFCAKTIAGLGQLPDTVESRSIPIRMQRKTAAEKVARWRTRKAPEEAGPLRDRLEEWASEYEDTLAGMDLAPLDELPDRAADIWEPLLGIAHLAGEQWFIRARRAAKNLSGRGRGDDSARVRLLSDLRSIFGDQDTLWSAVAIDALTGIEEADWSEWGRSGKPLTKTGLAKLLRPFGIVPKTVRIGESTAKGYEQKQFVEVWNRYLGPSLPPIPTVTPSQPAPEAGSLDFPTVTNAADVTVGNERDPAWEAECDVVTVAEGGNGHLTHEQRERLRVERDRLRREQIAAEDADLREKGRALFADDEGTT